MAYNRFAVNSLPGCGYWIGKGMGSNLMPQSTPYETATENTAEAVRSLTNAATGLAKSTANVFGASIQELESDKFTLKRIRR